MSKEKKQRNTNKKSATISPVEELIKSIDKVNSKKERKVKFQTFKKMIEEKIVLKESQEKYSETIKNNQITFAVGAAGTSKTFTACFTLLKMLFDGKIDRIVFTKPIKESGESLGHLPGTIDEKMEPYVESFIYTCKEIIKPDIIDYLIESGYIECRPLAYMRGITLKKCGMFLDEAQNTTYNQLMLYITRLGDESKMIIAGDMTQRDIGKKDAIFNQFINMLSSVKGVGIHHFKREDIVRNPILIEITDLYEKWKEEKGI